MAVSYTTPPSINQMSPGRGVLTMEDGTTIELQITQLQLQRNSVPVSTMDGEEWGMGLDTEFTISGLLINDEGLRAMVPQLEQHRKRATEDEPIPVEVRRGDGDSRMRGL